MFVLLWKHGRALVPASGWFEWKKSPEHPRLKQPYFIHHADRQPLFFAALNVADPEGTCQRCHHHDCQSCPLAFNSPKLIQSI